MSHHSSNDPFFQNTPARRDLMRQLLNTTGFIGATGQFPDGALSPNDEGQIQFATSIIDGRVILDFGKPVSSLGMSPQEACDIAGALVKLARAAARRTGETVALTLV
jgi:hypothetical protein